MNTALCVGVKLRTLDVVCDLFPAGSRHTNTDHVVHTRYMCLYKKMQYNILDNWWGRYAAVKVTN